MISKQIFVGKMPIRRFLEKTFGYTAFEAGCIVESNPSLCEAIARAAIQLRSNAFQLEELTSVCKKAGMADAEIQMLVRRLQDSVQEVEVE